MIELTDKIIAPVAEQIYQRAGGANRKYGDHFSDWMQAIDYIKREAIFFQEKWLGGECGT
jgi:hypothetical protein